MSPFLWFLGGAMSGCCLGLLLGGLFGAEKREALEAENHVLSEECDRLSSALTRTLQKIWPPEVA